MRLSEFQKEAIVNAVQDIDSKASIWLFGSRADDSKKGGDIDIAVLSTRIGVMEKIQIKRAICNKIGEQKIDLLVSSGGDEAFFRFAAEEGIKLSE
ncbi:MAG: nucleotidyltransferase domain-containing protein [Treponema sp.]|jgi:predicted nucleotidyltransferase|nr:nucleotidyltransferase domain-containing protein [Treponema sp.]